MGRRPVLSGLRFGYEVLPFEKSYPEHLQNPHLVNELSAELPGILNWAFKGLKSLRQAGRFTIPQKCRQASEQYRRDVNPARAFLLDNYVAYFDYDGLPTQEVYACYVAWCQNNGYRPLNSNNFGKEVKRTLPGVRKGQKREGLQRMNVYYGLAVQEGSEVAVESVEGCQQWQ